MPSPVTNDIESAPALFADSTDFTVGIEEEFGLLDPGSLDLVQRFEQLRDAAASDAALSASIAGELISSEIEIRSGRGTDLHAAIAAQRELRPRLFAHASANGTALSATGTHPFADYREQHIIDTEHYRRVEQGLRYVARRNNTFSLHVHVGIRDIERAVAVCDRLRPALPLLLAVSANSTCLDGCDAGLHSARTQIFTRSFPRCGVPDAYGSWKTYAEYLDLLVRTRSIVEYTQVWWSVRPHLGFGTVEMRICDAQSTAQESEALAALIVACVAQAARDHDERRPFEHPTRRAIEENMWRATRYGLDGELIDLGSGELFAARAALERLAAWSAPVRAELGIDVSWPYELNGAQRQRRALDAGQSPRDVFATCVRETSETYAEKVTV